MRLTFVQLAWLDFQHHIWTLTELPTLAESKEAQEMSQRAGVHAL